VGSNGTVFDRPFYGRGDKMSTRIIFVGGFLGAGKTTLLFEAARKLTEQGKRVGLITNDQAADLVDTTFLKYTEGVVSEVSGSCFCCNFNGLTEAIFKHINENQADIIVAEPVGSCTDLSATIIQPLKHYFGDKLNIAPLTVLADPVRLSGIIEGGKHGLHSSAVYIIRKQLEEADIIVINKTDLLADESIEMLSRSVKEEWPDAEILTMSLKNGTGIDIWLERITHNLDAGTHLADVDYDIYAEGEAVLGWLNASFMLRGESVEWNTLAYNLLNALSRRFEDIKSEVCSAPRCQDIISKILSYAAPPLIVIF
jgi:G3E family GTPase